MKSLTTLLFFLLILFPLHAQYCNQPALFKQPIATNASGNPTYTPYYMVYDTGCRNPSVSVNCNIYIQKPNDSLNSAIQLRPAIIGLHGFCYLNGVFQPICDEWAAFLFSQSMVESYTKYGFATASIQYKQWIDSFDFCNTPKAEVARTHYRTIVQARKAIQQLYDSASQYFIDRDNIFLLGNSQGGMGMLHAALLKDEDEFFAAFPQYAGLEQEYGPLPPRIPIRGVINLSGFLYDTSFLNATDSTPLYLAHGVCDDIIPYEMGTPFNCPTGTFPEISGSLAIAARAHQQGVPYSLRTVNRMGHAWTDSMIAQVSGEDLRSWIKDQIICGTPQNEQIFYNAQEDSCADNFTTPSQLVAIKSVPHQEEILVWPNPFTGHINIRDGVCPSCLFTVTIYDQYGKKVIQKTQLNDQTIDLSLLKRGMYLLEVESAEISTRFQLLKILKL